MKLFVLLSLPLLLACSNDPVAESVEDAERKRAIAIARQDVSAYKALTSDDLLMVNDRGGIVTKDDRVGSIGSGDERRIRGSDSAVEVRRYGDVSIVLGRSIRQRDDEETHNYFTRIWVWRGGRWQMVVAHYTDITEQVIGDERDNFKMPNHPVPALPIAIAPPGDDAEAQVRRALDEEHRAYWSKEPDRYRKYVGFDLLRVAENGVRTLEDLIAGMENNPRLPALPPQHFDLRVLVYGNVAIATYRDNADDPWGRPAPAFSTVVFARRDLGWQMVHFQSTKIED